MAEFPQDFLADKKSSDWRQLYLSIWFYNNNQNSYRNFHFFRSSRVAWLVSISSSPISSQSLIPLKLTSLILFSYNQFRSRPNYFFSSSFPDSHSHRNSLYITISIFLFKQRLHLHKMPPQDAFAYAERPERTEQTRRQEEATWKRFWIILWPILLDPWTMCASHSFNHWLCPSALALRRVVITATSRIPFAAFLRYTER